MTEYKVKTTGQGDGTYHCEFYTDGEMGIRENDCPEIEQITQRHQREIGNTNKTLEEAITK